MCTDMKKGSDKRNIDGIKGETLEVLSSKDL